MKEENVVNVEIEAEMSQNQYFTKTMLVQHNIEVFWKSFELSDLTKTVLIDVELEEWYYYLMSYEADVEIKQKTCSINDIKVIFHFY